MDETTIFTWRDDKNESCFKDRHFDFAYAIQIFAGKTYEYIDNRHAYPETRIQAYGRIAGKPYRVVYTETDPLTKHIISAHRIGEKEFLKWCK